MPTRSRIPVWLMGLTNLTYGLFGGVIAFAIPQLLSNRHVSESQIASITAVSLSPGFWAFLFSPMLDVRFSRRWYSVLLAVMTAASVVVVFLSLDHLLLVEVALTVGFFTAFLYASAVGGWLSTIISAKDEGALGMWITIGNVGGFGIMAVSCNQIMRHLPPFAVALVLGGSILLPTLVFPFLQAPGPDRRLASESFGQFNRDLLSLVKRREVLIALILFVAPAGTFALTNFLGSRGEDFHAAPGLVGLMASAVRSPESLVACCLSRSAGSCRCARSMLPWASSGVSSRSASPCCRTFPLRSPPYSSPKISSRVSPSRSAWRSSSRSSAARTRSPPPRSASSVQPMACPFRTCCTSMRSALRTAALAAAW